MKYILPVLIVLLALSGMDCRKNPVGPPSGADTTSNSFTFQTYTFGAANAGYNRSLGYRGHHPQSNLSSRVSPFIT